MRHPCCQNTRKVRHVADVKYQQFRRVDLNQGQSAQIIAGATAPVAKVSDQCGPVTVCSNPLGVWPRRVDANARLDDWQRSDRSLSFRLKGYVPLEFSLAGIQHCTVSADGQPLTATRQTRQDEALIQHYRHAHAAAQIQVRCLSR